MRRAFLYPSHKSLWLCSSPPYVFSSVFPPNSLYGAIWRRVCDYDYKATRVQPTPDSACSTCYVESIVSTPAELVLHNKQLHSFVKRIISFYQENNSGALGIIPVYWCAPSIGHRDMEALELTLRISCGRILFLTTRWCWALWHFSTGFVIRIRGQRWFCLDFKEVKHNFLIPGE